MKMHKSCSESDKRKAVNYAVNSCDAFGSLEFKDVDKKNCQRYRSYDIR